MKWRKRNNGGRLKSCWRNGKEKKNDDEDDDEDDDDDDGVNDADGNPFHCSLSE